ncbi:ABC transporter G family member 20 [Portunus trituberculatus]|uniref:ABC transporter G family member 20 n=1 Tax=Portunus trituberculatus TaxID=210409 RepID=A0A5B7E7K1_PORTR|nr:ABC transporter G family member 20 [Portunus trituberculatus]
MPQSERFEEGYAAVEDGSTWGLIYFSPHFTKGLLAFYGSTQIPGVNQSDTEQATINVYMDNTNSQISATLGFALLNSLEKFLADVIVNVEDKVHVFWPDFHINTSKLALPINENTLENLASVQSSEVMLAHLATQMLVMLVQISLILVFMFPVFQLPCKGSMVWVVLLSVLQGFCGMTFGLMTSALSNDENTAIMMALGIFYPLLLLSGIVWPIQGIPVALRYVSYVLPQTYACEAIRAVLYKGWDITYATVYLGYLVTIAWLIIHLVIALIAIRDRKYIANGIPSSAYMSGISGSLDPPTVGPMEREIGNIKRSLPFHVLEIILLSTVYAGENEHLLVSPPPHSFPSCNVRKTSICLDPTRRMDGRRPSRSPSLPSPLPVAPSSGSLVCCASIGKSSSDDSKASKRRSSGSSSERESRRERREVAAEWQEDKRLCGTSGGRVTVRKLTSWSPECASQEVPVWGGARQAGSFPSPWRQEVAEVNRLLKDHWFRAGWSQHPPYHWAPRVVQAKGVPHHWYRPLTRRCKQSQGR